MLSGNHLTCSIRQKELTSPLRVRAEPAPLYSSGSRLSISGGTPQQQPEEKTGCDQIIQ